MSRSRLVMMAGVLAACVAAPALGQQLISIGLGSDDITPDGQTVLGSLYEADVQQQILYTWTRAAGATRLGIARGDGPAQISGGSSVVGYAGYNVENVGGFSYNSQQGWLQAVITRRWTQANGSVNLGLTPLGSSCDYQINSLGAMSRNGQYIVGSGWTAGSCGRFRAWVYDNSTQAFTLLPLSITPPPASSPSSATAAWGVSDDGTVVIGYDQNFTPAGLGSQHQATVWTRNGSTWTVSHLDPNGGNVGCLSGDGSVIYGKMSAYTMNQVFGTTNTTIIRWVRSSGTWTPTNLGGSAGFTPLGTNVDGSKMIGERCYWSADVNGGAPMDLTAYLTSRGITFGGVTIGNPFGGAVHSMSDDGSKITFNVEADGVCLPAFPMMLADLTNPACVPARVSFSPVSQVVPTPRELILNVFASGSWPLTHQWQKETSPGTWTNLTDDSCPVTNPTQYDIRGADTMQLRLGYLGVYNSTQLGSYRCIVTSECGSATSGVALVSATPPCGSADFNCDGDTGTDADIESFFACLSGNCPPAPCTSSADFNGDGDTGTDADIAAFFRVLAGGPC